MNSFFSSFISGLFCTASLFLISLVTVVGTKVLTSKIKNIFPSAPSPVQEPEQVKPSPRKRAKRKQKPSAVRSIEIDPSEIDRIYVKKIS